MRPIYNKWLKISLINFSLVGLLGITLRYKIAFSLPFIDQGNLLHAHSHFAFSGWVSQALMTGLILYLFKNSKADLSPKYEWIMMSNLIVSYGMLIAFTLQGYALFSILFSTLAIFVSYVFAIVYWKDLNKIELARNSHLWFKASLVFNVISSLGPFSLAFLMNDPSVNQKLYLLAIYYFLHFQYNGWFLFACLGLFISKLSELTIEEKKFKYIFWIFAISCIPTYFLSALWFALPKVIYQLVILSAFMQVTAWVWFIKLIRKHIPRLTAEVPTVANWLIALSAIALSIKLMLQLGSTYPPLGKLAFGYRPIVIGYLHLVMLGIISFLLLGYFISHRLIVVSKSVTLGIIILVLGVFLNEVLLMTQGLFAMASKTVDNINLYLLVAAVVMFTGISMVTIAGLYNSEEGLK